MLLLLGSFAGPQLIGHQARDADYLSAPLLPLGGCRGPSGCVRVEKGRIHKGWW